MIQNDKPINGHIEKYLDYYCKLQQAPEFAVLLKGQWGSGKTWFINNYRKKFEPNQQKCLYVSLYGMTSFAEIEYEFFRQLHPVLAARGMQLLGKFARGLIKTTINIDLNSDEKSDGSLMLGIPDLKLSENLKNIDDSILIFDDLERCNIEINSLFGYINNFVEHQFLKVIIVANEDELLDRKDFSDNEYQVIKEKLIGQTFDILPDFASALKEFIKNLSDSDLKHFLQNTELTKDLYEHANYKNLRTLKQIILDFERIFQVLPDRAKKRAECLQELFRFIIVFSIEIKRGRLCAKKIEFLEQEENEYFKDLANSDNSKAYMQNKNVSNSTLRTIVEIYSLGKISFSAIFPSLRWWQNFFDLGVLEAQELKELIEIKFFQDRQKMPNWKKILDFQDLKDDEFEDLLKKVESEYTQRQYCKLDIIKPITGLFFSLSEAGLYDKNKNSILEDSKKYIDHLKKDKKLGSKLLQNQDRQDNKEYDELRFNFKDIEKFKEIDEFNQFLSYIDEIQKQVDNEKIPKIAQDILNDMQNNVPKFRNSIIDSEGNSSYYNAPVLKYIPEQDFFAKLVEINKNDRKHFNRIINALNDRYESSDINQELFQEIDWLKSIRDLLVEEVNQNRKKLSEYWLGVLGKFYLNKIINKLESSQAQNTEIVLREE